MTYKFAGDGACVPGLPLEISEEEASQFNVEQRQVLEAAVASGVYVEVSSQPSAVSGQQRRPKSKKPESSGEGETP